MIKNINSKARGCIIGAAVGDALGMPTEGVPKSIFLREYGGEVRKFEKPQQNHPCAHLKAGQYTDDTQQMILLSKSLISTRGMNLFDFGNSVAADVESSDNRVKIVVHNDDLPRFYGDIRASAESNAEIGLG
jgi:ADP-ribosylglycohydrolase